MEDSTPLPRSTSPPSSLESKPHSTTRIPETPMRNSSTPRSTTPRDRSRPRLPAGPRNRTQPRHKDDSHDTAASPPSRSNRASAEGAAPESPPGGTHMTRWSSTSSSLYSAADSASQHGSTTARSRPVSEMQSPPAYSASGSSSPLPPSSSPHPSIQTPDYAPVSSQPASPRDDGDNRMVLSRARSYGQLSLVAEQSQLEAPPRLQSQQTSTPPPTPPTSSSLSIASTSPLPSSSPAPSFTTTTTTTATTTTTTPKPVPKQTPQPTPPPVSFDPPPLPNSAEYKPLTLDAAQWTLSSAELQGIVSSAIRESARERFVRLLRPGVVGDLAEIDPEREDSEGQALLERDLAQAERTRREALAKWRFEYGRRKMVLQSLFALAGADVGDGTGTLASLGGGGGPNPAVLQALLNQLAQSTAAMDALAATLVHAGAHAAQLTQLRDTHRASALAVALRKLNASYARRTRELVGEREKRATVEGEVEEAWRIAEEVAAEVDRLRDVVEGLEGRLRAQEEGRVEAGMQTEVEEEVAEVEEEVAEVEGVEVIVEPAEEPSWGGVQGKGPMEEDESWEEATVDGLSLMEDVTMTSVNRAQVIDVMGIAVASQARLTTVDDEEAAAAEKAFDEAEEAKEGANEEGAKGKEAQEEEAQEEEAREEVKDEVAEGADGMEGGATMEEMEGAGVADAEQEVEVVPSPLDKGKGKEEEPTSDEDDKKPFKAGHRRSASAATTTSLSRRLSTASQVSRVSAARKRSIRTSKASLRMPREWLATPSATQGDTRSRRARSRSRRRSMSLERNRPPMPELPADVQGVRDDIEPDAASFLDMNAEAGQGAAEDEGEDQDVIAPPLSPAHPYSAGFVPPKRPRSPTTPNILSRFAAASGPAPAPASLAARYLHDPEPTNSLTLSSSSSAASQFASHIFPHATLGAGPSRRRHPKPKAGSEPNIQLPLSALPEVSEDGVLERRGGSLDWTPARTSSLKKTSGLKRSMSDLLRFGKARRKSVPVPSALGSSALTRS